MSFSVKKWRRQGYALVAFMVTGIVVCAYFAATAKVDWARAMYGGYIGTLTVCLFTVVHGLIDDIRRPL